jgi:hypothetical protein
MKQMRILSLFALAATMLFTSCIKQDSKVYSGGTKVEFDATVLNAPAVGKTFPLLTRVPAYGIAVSTANPTITRTSPGVIRFRVNLVGPQASTDRTVNYRVVAAETTAISGTHYTTGSSFVIPANSSFGEVAVTILNSGVASTTPVTLVLELVGDGAGITASTNYRFLGMSIAQ